MPDAPGRSQTQALSRPETYSFGSGAHLAGTAGLSVSVLERATDVFKLPRAIHFDAHVMRILQQARIARDMLPETRVWKRSTFYGADGQPIRVHDWPDDQLYGWDAHYLFYQPTLEKLLRAGLDRHEAVDVQLGVEVVAVKQYADHVTVTTREVATGRQAEVSGRHLIAADGASSFVRDSLGIRLLDDGIMPERREETGLADTAFQMAGAADIRIDGCVSVKACRRRAWSSPRLSSRDVANPRLLGPTGSRSPGSLGWSGPASRSAALSSPSPRCIPCKA